MPKLCQITALLSGKKTQTKNAITEIYKRLQKPVLFQGLSKRYTPKDDEGDKFPDENQKVQFCVDGCLDEVRAAMVSMLDLTATQDASNCVAKADVKVGDKVVLAKVPVTHLLFLEKQLIDLHTLIGSVPTLDPQENWNYDSNAGYFTSEPVSTTKMRKTIKTLVKYPATEQHPAQTEVYNEDVIVGTWNALKFSAAIPADQKTALLERVGQLQEAVKMAREEANSVDATVVKFGDAIFDFVLGTK
jgi:uncharacterized protein affecting Mg2+/Co2+ transport